jgi:hypothetical protein
MAGLPELAMPLQWPNHPAGMWRCNPYEARSIWALEGFEVAAIDSGAVLATYMSAHQSTTGQSHRRTPRSSLWPKTAAGWRMRFHKEHLQMKCRAPDNGLHRTAASAGED